MTKGEFTDFLVNTEGALASFSRNGAIAFVCMDHHHAGEQIAAGDLVFGKRLNICVWVKSNGGMGSLYQSRHELVFVYSIGEEAHTNNIELGRHGRNRTNVWEYGLVNTFGSSRRHELELHPTTKPIALVSDAIQDVSARGDIVLDGFLGSGTTLIAAAQVGRTAYGLRSMLDMLIPRSPGGGRSPGLRQCSRAAARRSPPWRIGGAPQPLPQQCARLTQLEMTHDRRSRS